MLSEQYRRDAREEEFAADARPPERLSSQRVFLAHKRELSGGRKAANRARYRRGGKAAFFNGPHRRRNKRN